MKTKEQLAADLAQCTGTMNYWKQPPLPFQYTDGIKTFCEGAEAYWFLSELLDFIDIFKKNYLSVIKLKVANSAATIKVIGDNDEVAITRQIVFTDCPEGEYVFYMYWKGSDRPMLIWRSER